MIEVQTPSCAMMYRLVRDFAASTRPWQTAIRYQTKPDERNDLTLVSQRVYGRRDEFLAVMAAAGLDSVEQELTEQLLVLPTDATLRAFKERASFKNTALQRRQAMATAPKKNIEGLLGAIAGAAGRAKTSFKAESLHRTQAQRILTPEMVGGETMVHALMTTLGGVIRPITAEDLKQFRRNVGVLKAKVTKNAMRGGIRPAQAIQFSGDEDVERANREIHTAVLAGGNKGVLRFVTNSGPDSDRPNHHVHVQLGSWAAATSSPRKPKELAKWVANEPIRYDCDCGRHTYWLRYIATIGGWNYGRDENGFPKIRNPRLKGVACKHVLRVMRELMKNAAVHAKIAKMIESGRPVVIKKQDAKAMAEGKTQAIKKVAPVKKAARAAGLAIKLTKAGLGAKKPEAQLKAEAKANAKEAVLLAMNQQAAKLKSLGLTADEIKQAFAAMAESVK